MQARLPIALLAALALLAAPRAGAQDRSRPPPASRAAPPPPSAPAAAEARPVPPPSGQPGQAGRPVPPPDGSTHPRPPPPGAYRPPPVYVAPPSWYGWGWGYGYAPLWWGYGWWGYAEPPPGAAAPPPPSPPADRVASTLRGYGFSGEGTGGGLSFAAEGRRGGLRFSVDGLTPDRIDGAARLPATDPMAYGVAALTWSFVSAETHRLRVEVGGSMLEMPAAGSYQGTPYGGTTAFGLLLGLSGQVGLAGPLGLEGYLRTTPYPVLVLDAGLALAVRFGPAAVTGGWRLVEISGSSGNGPDARLSGPELGLALAF